MNTDLETIQICLSNLLPSSLDYEEWLKVGIAIKNSGGSVEMWDAWSSRGDVRYRKNDCKSRWKGLGTSGERVTAASVVKFCLDRGITPDLPRSYDPNWDKPLDVDKMILDGSGVFASPQNVRIVRTEWLETKQLPPEPENWSGVRDLIEYLKALFSNDEYVGYVTDAFQSDADEAGTRKWLPKKGTYSQTAGSLIEKLEQCNEDMGSVIGDTKPEAGAWIRFNPLDGNGVADANVTSYRHALVESDEISVERQYSIYKELELPLAALVLSGGKSLHAIVKIDAGDYKEYQKRVDYLYDVCKKNGLAIDRKNRNPSRLSRLPGAIRNGNKQRLLEVNTGKSSWKEWEEWIATKNDDLPDIENLGDFIDCLPPLADCLIDGVLRKGHKMMISGPSKAGKSYLLMELAVAIAEGASWLGWKCATGNVLYLNLELDRSSGFHRIHDVYQAMGLRPDHAERLDVWNLRGHSMPMDKLAPKLIRRALKKQYTAVIVDPIYKVITGSENEADQMSKFCNLFDKIAIELKCAVIYCHHHSKGFQFGKQAQDRAAGSGVFARDADVLLDIIQLEIDDKRRENIVEILGKEKLLEILNRRHPEWTAKMCPGEELTKEKLAGYARDYWDAEEIIPEIECAERHLADCTGWRVSGILREFAGFKPKNCFFCYPLHVLDTQDLLSDAPELGTQITKYSKWNRKSKKEPQDRTEKNIQETQEAVRFLSGDGEITIKKLAEYLQIKDEGNVRDRLKKAGIKYHRGKVVYNSGVSGVSGVSE